MSAKLYTPTTFFDFDAPEFVIEDIAQTLAQICRFGGRCKAFYSVAEHSLLVAGLMAELKLGDPFEGLMHDAAEAYVGDIPNPLKPRWTAVVEDERRVDAAIREQYKLPQTKTDGCRRADKLAVLIEGHYLLHDGGASLVDVDRLNHEAHELIKNHWKVHGFDSKLAAHLWMKGYKHYGPKIEVASANVEAEAARAQAGDEAQGSSLVIA